MVWSCIIYWTGNSCCVIYVAILWLRLAVLVHTFPVLLNTALYDMVRVLDMEPAVLACALLASSISTSSKNLSKNAETRFRMAVSKRRIRMA